MKRILIFILLLLLIPINTTSAKENVLHEEFIRELGIIDCFDDGTFRAEVYVTNNEFIKAIGVILNNNDIDAQALIDGGFLQEKLKEKETLKRDDMIFSMVKLLGYPNEDYLKFASDSGLYKNIESKNQYVTRGEFAQIVYNTLISKKFVIDNIAGDKLTFQRKTTILEERFKIKRVVDIVNGDDTSCINNQIELVKGEILLGNMILKTDINTKEYLGRKVEAFVRFENEYNNEGELVLLRKYNNEEIKVTSQYIDGATSNSELVWIDYASERVKKKDINKDTVIILNGVNVGTAENQMPSVFTPSDGEVNLIDNDADGETEVAIIWSYLTYIVDHVNTTNETITDKTGAIVSLKDKNYLVYDENNELMSFGDIKPYDVLSIAFGGNSDDIMIMVSSKEIVRGVYIRDGYYIRVENDEYSLNGYCILNNVKNGDYVKVYLDIYNRAAYVVKEDEYKYGFLTKAYYENIYEEKLFLKMYLFDEGVTKKELADSVTVVSESGKVKYYKNRVQDRNYNVLYNLINTKQEIIKFKTNSKGYIKEIIFTTSKIGYEIPDNTDPLEAYYGVSTGGVIKSREAKYIQKKFVSKYIITPDTKLLSLEKAAVNSEEYLDEEKFRSLSIEDLTDDYDYWVRIYDVNERFEAGLVIFDKVEDWYTKFGSVITNVSHTVDEDGEECVKLSILTLGEEGSIIADNPDMLSDTTVAQKFSNANVKVSDLTVGDVIYYRLGNDGKVAAFAVLHKNIKTGNPQYYHRSNYGWGGNYIPNAAMTVTYFKVIKTFSDLIVAEIDGARPIGIYPWCNYYICENNKIRKASFSDIKSGDSVVALWKWSNMNDLIIYR